jgi:DNA-binding beta-propeller fold protein YncE
LNLFTAGTTPGAVFNRVRQVAVAPDGSLRIVDSVNQRIVWTDRFGSISPGSTWVDGVNPGTEQSTCGQRGWSPGSFNWPRGIAIDASTGDLWVADTKQSDLQVIHTDCTGAVIVGKAGTASNRFNWPYQVAIRQSDRIAFVADTMNNRVVAYDVATRTPIATFGTKGTGVGHFNRPAGIAVGSGGDVFVADETNNRIVELSYAAGAFGWIGSYTGSASLLKPDGVAVDSSGEIFVADTGHSQLVVLNADGSLYSVFKPAGSGALTSPQSVTLDANGCIYLSDTYNDVVDVYTFDTGSCT